MITTPEQDRPEAVIRPLPSVNNAEMAGQPSLAQYIEAVRTRWWVVPLVMAIVVAAITLFTLAQEKTYTASASMLIGREAPQFLGKAEGDYRLQAGRRNNRAFERYLETQPHLLRGEPVLGRVVDRYGLDQRPEIGGPPVDSNGVEVPEQERRARAIKWLSKNSRVLPVDGTEIVKIIVSGADPVEVAELANAIVEAYLDYTFHLQRQATTGAIEWLTAEQEGLKNGVREAEGRLYRFREEHQILGRPDEDSENSVVQQVAALSSALTNAEIHRIALQSELDEVKRYLKAQDGDAPPHIQKDSLVQEQRRRVHTLQAKEAQQSAIVGPKHPSLVSLRAELTHSRNALASELERILRGLQSQLDEAYENERMLRDRLDSQTASAVALSRLESEYNQLVLDLRDKRRLASMVSERRTTTELASRLETTNVHQYERAVAPTKPSRPRVGLNITMGVLLGLFLGIMAAVALDQLDDAIRHAPEVEERLGITVLGTIPTVRPANADKKESHKRSERKGYADAYVLTHPTSMFSESFRGIRTNLLFMGPKEDFKSLLVTSAGVGEGKTSVASNLAAILAAANKRVLLIDTDLRRPRAHRVFDLDNDIGIGQVLLGDCSLDEAIRELNSGLHILTAGAHAPNPAEILASAAFNNLARELRRRYDWLIYDSPPLMLATDASILSRLVDGVVMVVRAGVTHRKAFAASARNLRSVNATILGAVVNEVDPRSGFGYGYGYGYGYRYGYGKYGYGRYGYGYGDDEEDSPKRETKTASKAPKADKNGGLSS
ncbi:MAG TPA: hypothetical protein DIU15_15225 [Deltaproteobacteria bacterium]|nr:hypothetical protein [Deltaproteobacteria bacterium]